MPEAVLLDCYETTPDNIGNFTKCEIVPIKGLLPPNEEKADAIENGFFVLLSFEASFDFALMQYTEGIEIYKKWKDNYYTVYQGFIRSAHRSLVNSYNHCLQILAGSKDTEDTRDLCDIFSHLGDKIQNLFIEDYLQGLANCRALRSYLAEAKQAATLLILEPV